MLWHSDVTEEDNHLTEVVWLALSWFNWQCKVVFIELIYESEKKVFIRKPMVSDGCLQSSHLSKYDSFHQHCCELWASATVVQKGVGSFLLTLLKSVLLQFVKNFILRIRAKFKVLIKVVFFDSFIILSKIRVSVSYLFHEIILIWNNTLPESFFFSKMFSNFL